MFYIYGIISTLLFIILLPVFYVISFIKPRLKDGGKCKFGFHNKPSLNSKSIWFYGISVGEVIALENLIKRTKTDFPQYKIVLTTGTKTGQEIALKKLSDTCDLITYQPFDIPFCINKTINLINPAVVIVAETELWPNFAHILNKKSIPQIIVNGRISDRTYKSYKKLSWIFKPVLQKYFGILTQSKQDNEKLISIGANFTTTKIMGNLKFDIEKKAVDIKFEGLENKRLIIAGSTHSGEDEILIETFLNLKKEFSDIKLLLAPRHLEKIKEWKWGKRSLNDDFNNNDIILLDTMGELSKAYGLCHFAFVGGSFNKTGGHNPLEATIYNKPTISGPSTHNFKDIYALLTNSKASKIVKTQEELEKYMKKLLSDNEFYEKACKDCENIFEENKGALIFVIQYLKNIL